MSNYFTHSYCSNSDLTRLAADLSTADQQEYTDAYRLGTLVHAMVLEPHRVDYFKNTVIGTSYVYTRAEIDNARRMRMAVLADSLTPVLMKHCEFEKEMYVESVQFGNIFLPCRCKYDAWAAALGYGFDLKSTTAKTQAQFENACRRFSYPRGRVFYCKVSGALRDVIIGVCKFPPYKVFKVFMSYGDPLWIEGEREVNELALKYFILKPEVV